VRVSRSTAGYTLPELVMVVVIIGVFVFSLTGSHALASEQARVDQAAGAMHSVWVAQRLYKLEHQTFASALQTLADSRYLENGLDELTEPFTYEIVTADSDEFTVQCVRSGSNVWFGNMNLNHNGLMWGSILGGGKNVSPTTLK
jgi:prepilin-type N-terminal cleavage/methylation domain-containing protein